MSVKRAFDEYRDYVKANSNEDGDGCYMEYDEWLESENARLKEENEKLREVVRVATCPQAVAAPTEPFDPGREV